MAVLIPDTVSASQTLGFNDPPGLEASTDTIGDGLGADLDSGTGDFVEKAFNTGHWVGEFQYGLQGLTDPLSWKVTVYRSFTLIPWSGPAVAGKAYAGGVLLDNQIIATYGFPSAIWAHGYQVRTLSGSHGPQVGDFDGILMMRVDPEPPPPGGPDDPKPPDDPGDDPYDTGDDFTQMRMRHGKWWSMGDQMPYADVYRDNDFAGE